MTERPACAFEVVHVRIAHFVLRHALRRLRTAACDET
jgi:hypothetical protein